MKNTIYISLILMTLAGCSHTKNPPNKDPSDYRPAVLPQSLPPLGDPVNDPGVEPGSPSSPNNQQLPKASP